VLARATPLAGIRSVITLCLRVPGSFRTRRAHTTYTAFTVDKRTKQRQSVSRASWMCFSSVIAEGMQDRPRAQ